MSGRGQAGELASELAGVVVVVVLLEALMESSQVVAVEQDP